MVNWVVSCHGYSDQRSSRLLKFTTRQGYVNCNIPKGIELVTYTRQGENLYGDIAWRLWDYLVLDSNENAAYNLRHKTKSDQDIISYGISGPHDASEYWNWVRPVTGEYACGLFEVGNPVPLETYNIGMSYKRLNDVINRAIAAKVKRIYWLACQALG